MQTNTRESVLPQSVQSSLSGVCLQSEAHALRKLEPQLFAQELYVALGLDVVEGMADFARTHDESGANSSHVLLAIHLLQPVSAVGLLDLVVGVT